MSTVAEDQGQPSSAERLTREQLPNCPRKQSPAPRVKEQADFGLKRAQKEIRYPA